jgi:hypothetical protein
MTLKIGNSDEINKNKPKLCKGKNVNKLYCILLKTLTCKHNLVSFFRPNRILTVELHRSFSYIFFFSGENAR